MMTMITRLLFGASILTLAASLWLLQLADVALDDTLAFQAEAKAFYGDIGASAQSVQPSEVVTRTPTGAIVTTGRVREARWSSMTLQQSGGRIVHLDLTDAPWFDRILANGQCVEVTWHDGEYADKFISMREVGCVLVAEAQ